MEGNLLVGAKKTQGAGASEHRGCIHHDSSWKNIMIRKHREEMFKDPLQTCFKMFIKLLLVTHFEFEDSSQMLITQHNTKSEA